MRAGLAFDPDLDARIGLLAVLGEPVRRALYLYVAAEADQVSRDQAAAALGIARHVAKFHLDRLVEDGLLEAEYRRPPGRGGPGAGRPAKVYRRTGIDVAVSVPERRYDLAGRLLARAVADAQRTGRPIL
jgi:predicted ArsR family transcriptional regulator